MIDPKQFVDCLSEVGLDYYFGVPDSLLKDFCSYVEHNSKSGQHVITANEGNAVAMATGYHLATGKSAVVYLQNSGLGNIINPLTSIADREVYNIPLLLIIGWRGEPGTNDEPQHVKQGKISSSQLDLLDIPYQIIDSNSVPSQVVNWVNDLLIEKGSTVALLVKKNTFSQYELKRDPSNFSSLSRETVLNNILHLSGDSTIISTTGKTSREVFELRHIRNELQRDFLTVGGMGHTSSIALGAAIANPAKSIVCIDGDGSALMHFGAIPIIGSLKPSNFTHILLNNASHESVGGQPTVADRIDFRSVCLACGYEAYFKVSTLEDLKEAWDSLSKKPGPVMLEVKIATGSRSDLGRPTSTPEENKKAFMSWMSN